MRSRVVAMVVLVLALGAQAPGAEAAPGDGWRGKTGAARSPRAHPKRSDGGLVDGRGRRTPGPDRSRDGHGRTLVQVDGDDTAAVVEAVTRHGGEVVLAGPGAVQANVPGSALDALSDEAAVRSVRPPQRPRPTASSEGTSSPGPGRVAGSGAAAWHEVNLVGQGTKVAVIDAGFAGYQSRLGTSLPATVTTINRCGSGSTGFDGSGPNGDLPQEPHGTAVAEIVHAMAPGAQLTLICVFSAAGVGQAVDDMAAAGIKVANMSLGSFVESRGDGSGGPGTLTHAVARGRGLGQLWVVSSGNSARDHVGFTLGDADGDTALELRGGTPVPGPDGAEVLTFTLDPGRWAYQELRWDAWPVTARDVTLCYWEGSITDEGFIGCSEPDQSLAPGAPAEAAAFQNETGVRQTYLLAAFHDSAPFGRRADLFFEGDEQGLSFSTASGSLTSPADSPFAFAVAAQCFADGRLEPFSSQGPTIDGRTKPDIAGPDGVSTGTYGTAAPVPSTATTACLQGSGGFLGTSASAPHVTGAAAVLLSANPGLGAAELETILQQRAVAPASSPVPGPGPYGKVPTTGAGQLNLGAPGPVAVPTPQKLHVDAEPTRVMDTRIGVGGSSAPLAHDETRTFLLPATVPADATAVVLNVTAVSGGSGFVTIFPSGSPRPNASNLNYAAGSATANHVTAAVTPASGGRVSLSIYNFGSSSHLIFDLGGWYGPGGSVGLNTLSAPRRAADTRAGTPLGPFSTLRVPLTTGLGVPPGATAVALNVTAVRATRPGFLSVVPSGGPPGTSSLNFIDGRAVPNLVLVKLGPDGAVDVKTDVDTTVDVLVDVFGWFDATGDGYVAIPPIRGLDSRTGTGPRLGALSSGESIALRVADRETVPHGAAAVQLNMTVASPSGGGYLTVWPSQTGEPDTSNLNYVPGQTVANGVIARRGVDGSVRIGNHNGRTDVLGDVGGYFAAPPPPPPALPAPSPTGA